MLVVDDNVDAAATLAALLRQQQHTVTVAHSGPVALDLVQDFRPDVALIDLGMPGMNGFELAERLRSSGRTDLLVVAVSGYSGEDTRRRARESGFDEYVVKPLDLEMLNALLVRQSR
jgi:two-component system CheB/CheR fusion protein